MPDLPPAPQPDRDHTRQGEPDRVGPPAWLTPLLALACGLIVANIYYAQPLVGPIAASLGLSPGAAGLIVTMTQIGYGIGLLLVVPLGDLVENRRLIACVTLCCVAALAAAALSRTAPQFLAASLAIGLSAVAVQIMVPYAASLSPEATRGRTVGNVLSGLLLGIMLARPLASLITHARDWQTVYIVSALATSTVALTLWRLLPRRVPPPGLGYADLLRSLATLVRTTPVLRRRAAYHACLFGGFSLFWTAAPLLLAGPRFRFSQAGIAAFGLAGVAGAVAAPVAGRLADRGHGRAATAGAMLLCLAGFALTEVGNLIGVTQRWGGVAVLTVAALLLDMGVSAHLTVGQRAIFSLPPHYHGRLNGLYLASFFAAGAAGSGVGGWAFAAGGWGWDAAIGAGFAMLALLCFATERRPAQPSSSR